MLAVTIAAAKTQIAQVRRHHGKPGLIDYHSYNNREFSDFDSILSLYLRKHNIKSNTLCIGAAGPVLGNAVSVTNLSWKISSEDLAEKFQFDNITLINDLVATAQGIFFLSDDKFFSLNSGKKQEFGNIGLVAPGSGLGECLIFYDGRKFRPMASEGGHASFAAGSRLEMELLSYLKEELDFVETEDIVSKPGLARVYRFMLHRNGRVAPDWFTGGDESANLILEKALSGEDKTAESAIDLFIDCLATEAANLALKGMTLGGIYLTGAMASQLMTMLEKGRFMQRFVLPGKLGKILAHIPVGVIIDDKTALLGAGGLALETQQ